MKLLAILLLVILAARFVASTPRGSHRELDAIGDCSVRDVAQGINSAVTKTGDFICGLWPESAPPKDADRHRADARRPAGSS